MPLPNPAYRPGTADAPAAAADPLDGWKARGCDAAVKDGIVTVTGKSDAPFLGCGAGKMSGPTVVTFRARTAGGGAGKVEWLPTPAATEKAKSVEFKLTGGDWQSVTVELPADGVLGIVRLYLPAAAQPVELDWVELKSAKGKPRRWEF